LERIRAIIILGSASRRKKVVVVIANSVDGESGKRKNVWRGVGKGVDE
jgi:hypothetical protein